jgi:hypothetical protein
VKTVENAVGDLTDWRKQRVANVMSLQTEKCLNVKM